MGHENLQLPSLALSVGLANSPRQCINGGQPPYPHTHQRCLQIAELPFFTTHWGWLPNQSPTSGWFYKTHLVLKLPALPPPHTYNFLPPERSLPQKWFSCQICRMPAISSHMLMHNSHWSPSLEGRNMGDLGPKTATHWPPIMENM